MKALIIFITISISSASIGADVTVEMLIKLEQTLRDTGVI